MLNIEIDNPELEETLKQLFGTNQQSIARAFADFVQQRKIKQDIGVSITQLDAGEGVPLQHVMQSIRQKYE
jgi:formaldehyde-activating enzyme involved in methanogenesis